MDGKDQPSDASSSSSGSSSSSSSTSGPEEENLLATATAAASIKGESEASGFAALGPHATSSGITNSGRWTNQEHELFLMGLEQYGSGAWKRITELVATRSTTQVRTHAQKYFLALQKPPTAEGSESGVANQRNPKFGRKKKNKIAGENGGSSKKKARVNGGAATAAAQRGLTGMSLLAQAAMVDNPEFDRLDQTVDQYEKTHPQTEDSSDEEGNSSGEEDVAAPAPLKLPSKRKPKQSGLLTPGQEIAMLRAQLQMANDSVQQLKSELQTTEARAVEAIEGRNIAINECRELQEMNSQLKMEQARILMVMEAGGAGAGAAAKNPFEAAAAAAAGSGATISPQAAAMQSAGLDQMQGLAGLLNPQAMAVAAKQSQQFQQQVQQQDQIVIEVLQSRLKEAEIRYHAVTESLARQTQVLTDQHRAILELNCKLEKERSLRETAEMQLGQLKREQLKK